MASVDVHLDGGHDLAVVGSGGAAFGPPSGPPTGGAGGHAGGGHGGRDVRERGCVPSKTLLAGAEARHTAGSHPFAGLPTQAGPVDMGALVAQEDELVGQLRPTKYVEVAAAYDFEILRGEARFVDSGTLEVNGEPLRAKAYVVATGAEPKVPALPGLVEAG